MLSKVCPVMAGLSIEMFQEYLVPDGMIFPAPLEGT